MWEALRIDRRFQHQVEVPDDSLGQAGGKTALQLRDLLDLLAVLIGQARDLGVVSTRACHDNGVSHGWAKIGSA
ncbi:MAG: hypothetical protein L0I24_08855 [Pseudonocardia sp.]|nr:hypothetical protein [Pseudonocardia sp.]